MEGAADSPVTFKSNRNVRFQSNLEASQSLI